MSSNRFRVALALVAALATLTATTPVVAWDRTGHQVVGRIAWEQLGPATRDRAVELLLQAPADSGLPALLPADARPLDARRRAFFQLAGYWPDLVRDREMPDRRERYHHGSWHYSNIFWEVAPGGEAVERRDLRPQPVNVIERLGVLSARLAEAGRPASQRAIDLAWLAHLTGDVHQPLHMSGRVTELEPEGDRGGNLFKIHDDGNLHWYWDSILSRSYRHRFWLDEDEYVGRIARDVMDRHPRGSLTAELTVQDIRAWGRESYETATTVVFPPTLERGKEPPRSYRKTALGTSQRRIALAGYRLADLIEQALGAGAATLGNRRSPR